MPERKKQTKVKENKEKKIESTKNQEKNNKIKVRENEIEEKIKMIREDLQNQLILQNKFGAQFDDLVEHYLYLVKLKDTLRYDIEDNGLRYEVKTGNGYTTLKPNESVKNLATISNEMRKILSDLDLKEPETDLTNESTAKEGEGDDLL